MGLQLIFVMETNKKSKSDWKYIRSTYEFFYKYGRTEVKFTPIFMDGKHKYKDKEAEISKKIAEYKATVKTNRSVVIYCFDCDEYDNQEEDRVFLKETKEYCNNRGAEFVWFCKDIERVFLGKKVENSNKSKEADAFMMRGKIKKIESKNLCCERYQNQKSNILTILDKYLERK